MGRRTSLVVQWIGIRRPMEGTRINSLVWEDSTRYRTSPCTTTIEPLEPPRSCNCWAQALQPVRQQQATAMRSLCPATKSRPHLREVEKAHASSKHPAQTPRPPQNFF